MKGVIICNITATICWYICSVGNFSMGNTGLAVFQLILAIVWTIISVINYKNYKSGK